jgi:hypothetical protein
MYARLHMKTDENRNLKINVFICVINLFRVVVMVNKFNLFFLKVLIHFRIKSNLGMLLY